MANPLPAPVSVADEYLAALLAEVRALRGEVQALAQCLREQRQSAPAPSVAPSAAVAAVSKMTRKAK